MPITISHENEGFRMKISEPGFGRGFKVFARNVDEMKQTLEHYYCSNDRNPNHYNGKGVPECPLCRMPKKG